MLNTQRLTQKHKNQVDQQDVGEVERCAQDFRQREAEQLSVIEDWNGLDHGNS